MNSLYKNIQPLPFNYWDYSFTRIGQPICHCRKGYGSKFDGLCIYCRGYTAYEIKIKLGVNLK